MTVIKKYGNRRLYDTNESRYVTLDELAETIRDGADVRVLDARTNADLTQSTLAQIILESRGASKLLPVPLLVQLIRMGDDALAEFFGRFITYALELYVQARQGAQAVAPYNPFMGIPFTAGNTLARFFGVPENAPAPKGRAASAARSASGARAAAAEPAERNGAAPDELSQLRRELDDLKATLRQKRKKRRS